MASRLENLASTGAIKAEPADEAEVRGLVAAGLARLNDADVESLSLESRFDLAYNAAHALSLAALRRKGYRPANRYVVFQVLPETTGLGPDVWRVLAKAHDARNKVEYTGAGEVDARLLIDLIQAAKRVAAKL
jgi:hypothetical protein